MHYQEVLEFWFSELTPKSWWEKNADLDANILHRFAEVHRRAAASELWEWRDSAQGRLAEIIVLDQFSRNMYRNTPGAFATDPLSLCLSQHAVAAGADTQLEEGQQTFLYMPHMHSESKAVQQLAEQLYASSGEQTRGVAASHKQIIDRFGRYPHRNKILGRTSTAEELEFLNQPNSSF